MPCPEGAFFADPEEMRRTYPEGTDLDDSVARLARHLAADDDRDLDLLIDTLLRTGAAAGRRTDDIALLVLRHEAHRPPRAAPPTA